MIRRLLVVLAIVPLITICGPSELELEQEKTKELTAEAIAAPSTGCAASRASATGRHGRPPGRHLPTTTSPNPWQSGPNGTTSPERSRR